MIKKASIILLSIVLAFAFSACSNITSKPTEKETITFSNDNEISTSDNKQSTENKSEENEQMNPSVLVVYFSATGTTKRIDREQNDPSARPAISGSVKNMDEYDTIILGYPIWHSQAPRIINTFLESYNFAGKTIIPFCTSHSSGIGSSDTDLHSLCSDRTSWIKGKRFSSDTSHSDVNEWLNSIDSLKS